MNEQTDSGGFALPGDTVAFKRRFLVPGLVITAAELMFIVWPAWALFEPGPAQRAALLKLAAPVLAGALLLWFGAMATWLSPIQRAIAHRRRREKIPSELAARAYRASWKIPMRSLLLRAALWTGIAGAIGAGLSAYTGWDSRLAGQLTALVGLHAFTINLIRTAWYAHLMRDVRLRLFPEVSTLRQFADGYFGRLVRVTLAVTGGAVAAVAAFQFYFVLPDDQYLRVQLNLPIAAACGVLVWITIAYRWTRRIDRYLDVQTSRSDGAKPPMDAAATAADAPAVYARAQALPYRLSTVTIAIWLAAGALVAVTARSMLDLPFDDAVLLFGITIVIGVGAAIYQALLHRDTMRPLLGHLTVRHRLPIRGIRPALSLRTKLLLSFGGVVLFACGLALFWGFTQYKNLVTGFVSRQAELGMAWLRSEIQAEIAARSEPPSPAMVRDIMLGMDAASLAENAVYYYRPPGELAPVLPLGGGLQGPPRLPWYAVAHMRLAGDAALTVGSHGLSGRRGPLVADWHGQEYELGSIAVFYPTYRGRGESIERPLKELFVFFLVLFGVCAGIAVLTVAEFVKPIRQLEQRADGMARGELAQPVTSGGEGDEIGRLTFALEEMRRALREKLRSTEEVNLDLERAVQRRTSDLAKKNRELAETLQKLTRAQSQLVRSEKMASIGQLVAGIAHEINNPVNAIVNTVGPLDDLLEDLAGKGAIDADDKTDMRDMLRVIQRGAVRTKDIVQALHNYSRTDDESVVDVDINRSLDDSLELLRHLLKQSIRVTRDYAEVSRVRGHAGQLNQVFMNLLTNAAQAVQGRDGATIWVATEETPDGVVIRVRDNGPGIPDHVLPRIFDPFFTTKDVGEGTGLGLSITHELVERHGGTIEVDSTPERGTVFTVTLPRTGKDLGRNVTRRVDAGA